VSETIVLGAGMVGVSVALHLQRRGRQVLLVDRRPPGRETSYGNAGIIQREAVRPRAFPRRFGELLRIAAGRGLDTRYALSALPGYAAPLARYWWHSAPARYRRIVTEYASLIAHATSEHAPLIVDAGAGDLIARDGFLLAFRCAAARDAAFADAEGDRREFGVGSAQLDGAALARLEPILQIEMAGALHWTDPWTVRDPGALVTAYAELFVREGGRIASGDAETLKASGAGWRVDTAAGPETAGEVVMALGPWAAEATRRLGYRLPLFAKRGYHREYAHGEGAGLRHHLLDAEAGYLLAPMRRGLRITTGAEFAGCDAPPNPAQIDGAEAVARQLLPLGDRLDPAPWLGARPCTVDMKPIIGRAPRHANLWLAIGHGHQGLTLGPATGRLLAEMMTGEAPFIDPAPFAVERFA
jgi:D-amino-acid dehydrogenase